MSSGPVLKLHYFYNFNSVFFLNDARSNQLMGIEITDLFRILRNMMKTLVGWTDREDAEKRRELTGTSFQYQRVGHC